MQCMQNLKTFYLEIEHLGRVNLLEGTHAQKYSNKFGVLLAYSYLCSRFQGVSASAG